MTGRRIVFVVTARPSYSRIKSAIAEVAQHTSLEPIIVAVGPSLIDKYGRIADQIRSDSLAPLIELDAFQDVGGTEGMVQTTAVSMARLNEVFTELCPRAVVTIADRYETLSTAVASSYRNIPLIHIQGGEVSGSIDDKVRFAVTALADYHLVANQEAARRVIAAGANSSNVFITGCPSIDLAKEARGSFDSERSYLQELGLDCANGEIPKFVVVLQHPVTTEHLSAGTQILETIKAVSKLRMPTLWFRSNPDAGSDLVTNSINRYMDDSTKERVTFFTHVEGVHFLKILMQSQCLIGNSSVGIRECSYLGVPVVNIGTRQRGRLRGRNVIDVGYDHNEIYAAVRAQLRDQIRQSETIYGDGAAGQTIARILSNLPIFASSAAPQSSTINHKHRDVAHEHIGR